MAERMIGAFSDLVNSISESNEVSGNFSSARRLSLRRMMDCVSSVAIASKVP